MPQFSHIFTDFEPPWGHRGSDEIFGRMKRYNSSRCSYYGTKVLFLNEYLRTLIQNVMSAGPVSEVDAFKHSVQGRFRNLMKNQMHFYHLLYLYFNFRWALHEKSQYFNFGPFPNIILELFFGESWIQEKKTNYKYYHEF